MGIFVHILSSRKKLNITSLSMTGAYHTGINKENQDSVYHADKNGVYVISLADGVSECSEARCGAETASSAITNLLLNKGNYLLGFEKNKIAEMTLSHIKAELEYRAVSDDKDIKEYSSTVAGVFYDRKTEPLLSINLGDSMIIAVENGCCRIFSMPSDSTMGCCVTTTHNAEKDLSVNIVNASGIEAMIIFSDGAWKHLFERNRLKSEIIHIFENQEYDRLKKYLSESNSFDDCSFIALDMRK